MNKNLCFWLLLLVTQVNFAQNKLQWQGYFSFNEIKDVSQSSKGVFAASENAIFSKNSATNIVKTTTTIDGLSGQTISALYCSESYSKTVVGYENGLLIVVDEKDGSIRKLVDIISKQLSAKIKRINHFMEYEGFLYISCDFGIVQFNLKTLQFGDTYFIGNNGAEVSVKQTTLYQGFIYAATQNGIRVAKITNSNLIDFKQWIVVNTGNWNAITSNDSQLIAIESTGNLYRFDSDNFKLFQPSTQAATDLRAIDNFFLVTNGTTVLVYDKQLALVRTVSATEVDKTPVNFTCATIINNIIYVGTQNNGLYSSHLTTVSGFTNETPTGPLRNTIFSMDVTPTSVWAVYGDYDQYYNPYGLDSYGLSKFSNSNWFHIPYQDVFGAKSITRIVVNPKNEKEVYASSFFSGLLKIENDEPSILFNQKNSGLETLTFLGPNYIDVRINGTAFDKLGNLWVTNSLINSGLKVLKTNGQWQSYLMTSILDKAEDASFGSMIIDKNSTKWMVTNRDGVVAFNENGNLFKKMTIGQEAGNLPSKDVRALAIDTNSQLWIGTSKGLRVLNSINNFQSENQMTANAIIIEDDGLAQELLYEQVISSIVVDGANNKWIGTADSGVFMVSSNGQVTKYHFTIDNSPLPSNTINDIKINTATGEVFIATQKGLVSFKGVSTSSNDDLSAVYIYPNPVRPNYSGTVKIAGLIDKANVKITDIEGNLVYETTAQGGTIEWDTTAIGKHKVASGVYMVFIAAKEGGETKVKKLMIIR